MSSSTTSPATSTGTSTSEWSAPDYGDAKPAVETYLKVMAANDAGLMDPQHPNMAVFDKYTKGQAHDVMVGSIQDEADHGTAWRGKPWGHRVVVKQQTRKAANFTLTDCPVVSPSWVQYDVATGKTIPKDARTPPPPYLVTVNVAKQRGVWVMVTIHLDASATCTR